MDQHARVRWLQSFVVYADIHLPSRQLFLDVDQQMDHSLVHPEI